MEKQITIAGKAFVIPQPFVAGHVITEGEAAALNQTFAENIRNNMAKKVKDENAGQDDVSKYASEYVFTVGRVASERKVVDPVEREARKIAKKLIDDKVRAEHNMSPAKYYKTDTDEGKAAYEAKVDQVSNLEKVLAQAAKNVRAQKKAFDELAAEL